MNRVLLDTDTLSFFFRSVPTIVARMREYLARYGYVHLSVVSYYELLNGLYYRDAHKQLSRFEGFVSVDHVLPITPEIAQLAAEISAHLRRTGQIIGHNDVLSAATAQHHGLTLVTNNTAHFGRIRKLHLDNWAA